MGNNIRKKIIIAYVSTGAGHFKAADAVYGYFKGNLKDIDVSLVDVLKKTDYFFAIFYIWGYSFLVNRVVFLWRWLFWLTYARPLRKLTRGIVRLVNRLNSQDLISFLCKENPDFVISTHFLPSEIAAYLKNEGKISSKLITIITDFGVHPFWISPGTDKYIAACEFTKKQLIQEGIKEDAINVLGIPVHPKFFKKQDKDVLCERLGIDKHKFTVLIVTGSFGMGPIEEIVELLHNDLQILAVCARNTGLYKRLKAKNYVNVYAYGFAQNIEELMAVSDITVTKPGGLSIAEILASELAPIFIHPIPGQETENIRVLAGYGIGVYAKSPKGVKDAVRDYKEHPEEMDIVKNNIRMLKKSFAAAQELYDAIC